MTRRIWPFLKKIPPKNPDWLPFFLALSSLDFSEFAAICPKWGHI